MDPQCFYSQIRLKGFLVNGIVKKMERLYLLGRYKGYRQINWRDVERLVFISKGTICRSPFAECGAKTQGMNCVSFGIDTLDGLQGDEKATQAATPMGDERGGGRARLLGPAQHSTVAAVSRTSRGCFIRT
jgi:hypothetical protein